MDVGSPDNGFDNINDYLKDDDTTCPDDIDLDFIVDKDIAENCIYGDLSVNDNFHLDLSEQEKQEPSSHSPSFRYYGNLVSPSQNIYPSVQSGFSNDTLGEKETVGDPGKLQVQSNENLHNEDSETLCNIYFHDSIFQMDSSPILQEIQNDVSALPHELVSMEDTNFQDILDKSTSPTHNEIAEHAYIEGVPNEPTQSELACGDADEEDPVEETYELCFSPGYWSRDPEIKRENINESRNSPCGYKKFEPSDIDKESQRRSPELCKTPYTNRETLSSPTIFSSSYQSPDIHELPGSPPEYQVIPNSPRLLKQTPSPTECNQEKESPSQDHVPVPHTEQLISASPLVLGDKHTENSPAEHLTSPKIFNRVEEAMQQPYNSRNTSCFRDKMDQCNRPDSRSPPDTKSNHMSLESGPSVSHSPKSQEVCPLHEVLVQTLCSPKSSKQKHVSFERSNSRCQSKSPRARNSIKGSPQHGSLKSKKLSGSQECTVQAPSSSMHKHEQVKMSNCRRSRSRSPYNRGCHNKSFESPRLPFSFKSSESNVSRSRLPCNRECHKRSLDKTSSEQFSQKKRSSVRDHAQVPSSSRSDNQKSESDNNKSSYNRLYSRSSCREDYNKRSLHEDPSAGRSLISQKVSDMQEDHAVSCYSRTSKMKSISIDTYKQKRSRSRSPDTGDYSKKSMRTAPRTVESPNSHKVSVMGEILLQPLSSRLCKNKIESLERSNLGKEFGSNDSVRRKHSASPRTTTTRQRPTKGAEKRLPASHYTHHNHQTRGRSISPSHTRQKDFSSGYKGDILNRYRSRSPYRRDNGMRSPRRRRSSRHRSPPPGHCHLQSTSRRTQWSPPQDRSTGLGKPGRDLFIAGFNFITTERDLERKFSRFGRVRDVRIVRDKRSGDSRGFGFLTLERDEQADAAIRALDKTEWGGRIVLVEKTKSH